MKLCQWKHDYATDIIVLYRIDIIIKMGLLHFLVKYALFLLNLAFTILGIALVTVGVLIHKKIQQLLESYSNEAVKDEELQAALQILSILTIVLGIIVFIIAFSGCCGAVTETKCLLVTYAVFVFFLITAKIYLVIVWNRDINTFRHSVNEFINDAFDQPAHNDTFHVMEASLHCCGTTGPDSYEVLPPTCCAVEGSINVESECLIEDAFDIGCSEYIDNFIANIANTAKTVLIWVIVFEALEFIGTVYLCTSIHRSGQSKSKPQHYH